MEEYGKRGEDAKSCKIKLVSIFSSVSDFGPGEVRAGNAGELGAG